MFKTQITSSDKRQLGGYTIDSCQLMCESDAECKVYN